MSRYRKGGKNRRQLQQDRPASVHRQQSLGRLQYWYNHKPVVTVDQLHKYRRKEFGTGPDGVVAPPPQPPISLSASPSFDTEYRCHFEPPYRTAEEMSVNRRHAAVPKDELQVEGDAEFSAEYAERYQDGPRERNVAARQGSHIGPFVCADDPAPEGVGAQSEQHDQYVPHPDGRRADNLRPGTGLRVDEGLMDGETEQMANYRKYPVTPHPDVTEQDQNEGTTPKKSSSPTTRRQPFDESMKEMVLTRDSGMLLRPARFIAVAGGQPRTERPRRIVKRPEFRLEVVDCTTSGDAKKVDRTDAFVVLLDNDDLPLPSGNFVNGGNRWVKRRQRKMGTVRFFDDRLARFPATGKTIQ
ncbi:uncharacterized protein LOC132930625 isoform X2 [Rhopalosiphum padi]|uniref:uncharacterized protein LOC132930625 isoform X2 n=1 Tax=Rhopalosiphum padi TaxID=40932 RepID=UPI00298EB0E8|nr:uncharacterized protein LOC132930625 isoform X2 [Rhopalosiphum padi]